VTLGYTLFPLASRPISAINKCKQKCVSSLLAFLFSVSRPIQISIMNEPASQTEQRRLVRGRTRLIRTYGVAPLWKPFFIDWNTSSTHHSIMNIIPLCLPGERTKRSTGVWQGPISLDITQLESFYSSMSPATPFLGHWKRAWFVSVSRLPAAELNERVFFISNIEYLINTIHR
jgi:hypothetical protein